MEKQSRNYKKEIKECEKQLEQAFNTYSEALLALPKGIITKEVTNLGILVYDLNDKLAYLRKFEFEDKMNRLSHSHY